MLAKELNSFLKSETLNFVPMNENYLEDYYKWINDREIIKNLETSHFPKTKKQLLHYMDSINESKDFVFFAVIEKNTNKYIGNAKLGPIDWINRTADYGRMIGAKDMQGKGYGTEMAKMLLYYAFMILNLNKVTAGTVENNLSSIKSNEKIGLEKEGVLKQQLYREGQYKDVIKMGITRAKYLTLNNIE
tara:strand:+ start:516 stop:1082 length:567 start_codon:yes stop_codon:yes gene_type:complete